MLDEILAYNRQFVKEKRYEQYMTAKYPDKKAAILTCMDTRLVELLPAALGLKNGDVKIIKNAGAVISNPFGSVIRSLLIAIFELGVAEIMVIGHTDCGVQHVNSQVMIEQMVERGIQRETIEHLKAGGVDFDRWLAGFGTVEQSISETVEIIRQHPLIPKDISIGGYVMDSVTGALSVVCPRAVA